MEKILLTGGTGFLGGQLAKRLSADGYDLRCVVRNLNKALHLQVQGAELLVGDLVDLEVVLEAARGVDSVVHAAALVGGWGSRNSYIRNNILPTKNLLDACANCGVKRFLFVSSVAAYGFQPYRRLTESSPPKPESNPYCQTKLECERMVREYSERNGVAATVIRPSIIYGPGNRRFLERVAQLVQGGTFVVIGKRVHGPPLVYVGDVENFVSLILRTQSSPFEVFNLSSPEHISWERIVEEIGGRLHVRAQLVSVPFSVAYGAGAVLEFFWRLARASESPPISRWSASLVGLPFNFDSTKALSVLGFPGFTPFSAALDASMPWILEEQRFNLGPSSPLDPPRK